MLDLTEGLGSYCGKLLSDLGAEVIQVEPPQGHPGRARPPFFHDQPGPDHSLWWWWFSTGKRSITLNITTAAGRDLLRRLVPTAAVVLEDRLPGNMAAWGLGYDDLRARNPGIIYTSITAYGQTGPYARFAASDLTGQAMGGLMYRVGWPDDPPNSFGGPQAYNQASSHGAIGILLALYHRDLTGEGQHVDVSMHEAVSIVNYDAIPRWALQQEVQRRRGPGVGSTGLSGTRLWPCKEGQVRFQVVGAAAYPEWPRLVGWLQEHGMAEDLAGEAWADPFYRVEHLEHVEAVIARFFRTMPARQVQEEGQDRRIMVMAFNTVKDLFDDPQLVSEGFFVEVAQPAAGAPVTFPGGPYRLSATPWRVGSAPTLGQDNAAVYGELGLTPAALAQLHSEGVV